MSPAPPAAPSAAPPKPDTTASKKPRFGLMARRTAAPDAAPSDVVVAPKLPVAVYLSSLFINLLGLALPLVMLQVYDRILPNQATETLSLLVLGMVGVMILDTALKIARAYMVGWVTARHHYEMATDAVARLLNASTPTLEAVNPTVHLDRLNALDTMREFYGGQSRLLLLDLPFIVIFLGLMAFIGGFLVFVPIIMFVLLGAVTIMRGSSLRQILQARAEHDDRRYDFIVESLSGIQTVKLMGMEPQLQRRFERLQRTGAEASHDTILLGNGAQILGNLFSNVTMIAVVTTGAFMVISGNLTMGTLAACTLLSGRTIQPLLRGLGLWTQIQTISVARERVEQLFELPEVSKQAPPTLPSYSGAVVIRDVGFSYGVGQPPVLQGVTIDIPPGAIVGLRGGAGSGKSTLIKLMRGELAPASGTIAVDGHLVCGPYRPAIADFTAYVPQAPSLFRGTILENITMFKTGSAIDDAREAARLIGLEVDIHRLPEGYDTPVSEGITDELPDGMMQRIVIARALARKPKILLFDEGNASLDSHSDKLLRDGIARLKGQLTIVLVSQRPSLLRLSDRIYALSNGVLSDASAEFGVAAAAPDAPAPSAAPMTQAAS